MKQLIGWLGRAFSFFLYISPAFVRKGIGGLLAFLWFDLFRIRRQVVLDNLQIAFPDWDRARRVRVGRQSLRFMGWNFVEYSLFPFLNKENYQRYFEFHGWELYEQAIARGKGVLLLTLHLGNGDMGCAGLALNGMPKKVGRGTPLMPA